jgi:hypothetical protein
MKSRKFKRNAKKNPVINKEQGTYDFTVSLPPELYKFVKEDAAFFDVDAALYLNMMMHNAIKDSRCVADDLRKTHGERFSYPEDWSSCPEESMFDFKKTH